MDYTDSYTAALTGILVVLLTIFVQWLVASTVKARQPGAVPGKIDPNLSHSSFLFRAHRTFMNSLENAPLMLGAAFLALLAGAHPLGTGVLIWIMAAARIIHMGLYYGIATEKNPSPRTYFFMIGVLASLGLLILATAAIIGG